MIRFDDTGRRVELGVHALLDAGPPTGHLQLQVAWSARARMRAGQEAHTAWQAARVEQDDAFQREVTIRHRMIVRDWEVTVQGRVDGLSQEGDRWVVEELKSSVLPGERIADALSGEEPFPGWVRQLRLYLWFMAERGRDAVGRLVVVSLVDGSRHLLHVAGAGDSAAYVRAQLDYLLLRHELRLAWLARRRAARVPFPHDAWRPGQDELAATCEEALHQGRHLLLTAPTGLGKTAAVLHAALRVAFQTDRRVFFATARTTQQKLAEQTLREMAARGLPVRAVSIRAREKVCLNEVVACRAESCRFAERYHDKLRTGEVVEKAWASAPGTADGAGTPVPEEVVVVADAAEVCPFALALELAAEADVVIGDYNYVFDPAVRLELLTDAPGEWLVIVDEAHNLPERAMGYLSPVLPVATAETAAEALAGVPDPRYRPFAELARDVLDWLEQRLEVLEPGEAVAMPVDEALGRAEVRAWADRVDEIALDYAMLSAKRAVFAAGETDPFLELARALLRLRGAVERAGEETLAIWRRGKERRRTGQLALLGGSSPRGLDDDAPGLELLCRDPSPVLGPFFDRLAGTVCMSATLEPPAFYRDLLALPPERLREARFGTPFPPENRRVLVVSSVSTQWRHRDRDRSATAALIGEVLAAVPGNVAVYYPSFAMMEALAPLVDGGARPVLTQGRRMTEAARADLLTTLQRGEGHVLHAVLGGIFAEGVDLPGGGLLAAVVVGPSLPAATLQRKLMQQWYQERYDQGFRYAWLVPGMARVVQAAGRVVRTPEDVGAIVLVGQRFVQNDYAAFFPSDWVPIRTRAPGEALAGLWGK